MGITKHANVGKMGVLEGEKKEKWAEKNIQRLNGWKLLKFIENNKLKFNKI